MGKRKGISASLRWQVFARDGFACLYCGAQAGQDGVSLAADHVISVADGGDNSIDNLVTACQRCNGGKGAKSLDAAPAPQDRAVDAAIERAARLHAMAEAAKQAVESRRVLEQQVVNIKCDAYRVRSIDIVKGEMSCAINLIREFGVELLAEWDGSAASRDVTVKNAIKYVCGCARMVRVQAALQEDAE